MVFKITFIRSDACLFERRIEWLPVEADNRISALNIFNKFMGMPFNFPIIDISVLQYDQE